MHLYCTLSQERIKNNTEEFSTFADEIAAITAAVECPRARNEPFVMSCYMSCLAQKLNQQVRSGALFPMSFGSKVFQEEKHVVEFIRSEAELRQRMVICRLQAVGSLVTDFFVSFTGESWP